MEQQGHIAVRDLFRNPEKVDFCISPDGKWLAYLAPANGRLNVHVQSLLTQEVKCLTDQNLRNIAGLAFADNEHVLYVQDVGGDENWQIFVNSVDGEHKTCLTPFPGVVSRVLNLLEDRPDEILIQCNKRNPSFFDVYLCNIRSGELTMIAENPGSITGWRTDHDGRVRVALRTDGVNHQVLYRETEHDEFRELLSADFKTEIAPLMFSFDNTKLIMLNNTHRNTVAVQEYDPANAIWGDILYEHDQYDIESVVSSKHRKKLLGVSYWSWKLEYLISDEQFRSMMDDLRKQLPTKNIKVVDNTRDESRFVVSAFDDVHPSVYYLYDVSTRQLTKIAESKPWLKSEDLCEVRAVQFQSRDGLTINGYLTLPTGVEAQQLPVVMYVHGGPWARDYLYFDPSIQLYANRGYAVMQINFRGSTGYGRAFWEASFKQWGRAMQNDISDGVEWLCRQGIADPKRVAICGGSYGGYAVLAGLTLTPDLYCCGIDVVGVSNLFTFRNTVPEYWKPMNQMLDEMIGSVTAEEAMLREVSPFFHADRIKVPLLVFQGAKDPRVNIAESDQIVSALRSRGIEVEYIVKAEEGHGFVNEENRLEMFEIIDRFLRQHLR